MKMKPVHWIMSVMVGATTSIHRVASYQVAPILRSKRLGPYRQLAALDTEPMTLASEIYDPATISSRVFGTDRRPVILFDGVCNMCNNAVNVALDWDKDGKLRFSALQSNVGRALLQVNGRNADDISSIVLVTSDGAYIKSDAILKITEELTPFALLPLKPAVALGRLFIPKSLRDILYDGVAENRYSIMGKRDECRLDHDGAFNDRFVDDKIALRNK